MLRKLSVLAVLAVLGLAGYAAHWLSLPCQPLDRMFGMSGCEANLVVSRFTLIDAAAMSPQDADGEASLFGYVMEELKWVPGMVRLDLDSLTELSRSTLGLGDSFGHLTFSDDGTKAVLACMGPTPCTNDGKRSGILSVRDGALLETGGYDDEFVRFPGDVAPTQGSGVGLFAAAGERIVDIRRDGTIALLDAAGEEVAMLHEGRRNDVLRSGVSVSPSGNHVAMFDRSDESSGARLLIWDARSGAKLRELALGPDYRHRFTPVWVDRDAKIALVRAVGRDTSVDIYRAL